MRAANSSAHSTEKLKPREPMAAQIHRLGCGPASSGPTSGIRSVLTQQLPFQAMIAADASAESVPLEIPDPARHAPCHAKTNRPDLAFACTPLSAGKCKLPAAEPSTPWTRTNWWSPLRESYALAAWRALAPVTPWVSCAAWARWCKASKSAVPP